MSTSPAQKNECELPRPSIGLLEEVGKLKASIKVKRP
jgi:hypothetical protein